MQSVSPQALLTLLQSRSKIMFKFLFINNILVFILIASASLKADPISFDLHYSGGGNNSAQGIGSVTFDKTNLPNPGTARTEEPRTNESLLTVIDFNLIITGAKSGNGTFGLSDFEGFLWEANIPLDLNSDLIEQLNSEGDFDFAFSPVTGSGAPVSVFFLAITTNEDIERSESLSLVSMSPVPIPSVSCTSDNSGVVSPNLDIHMPSLNYQSINIFLDIEYLGINPEGRLTWGLKDAGVNE